MTQLLNAIGISKSYGATKALTGVDIRVDAGRVVALLGANGSGKSTLTRILTGAASVDEGSVEFDGSAYAPKSPQLAQRAGVVAVAQELSLVPSMTVAQNIWLGGLRELPRGGSLTRRQHRATAPLLALFEGVQRLSVQPGSLVADLSPDERQIVEILKARARNPKLMILDEATSTLDRTQVARLFDLMRDWCAEGMGIIFVSHRMDEVFAVSNEVCVVRGGVTVLGSKTEDVTRDSVVSAMTGSREGLVPDDDAVVGGRSDLVVLNLESFAAPGVLPTSLDLRRGEILGLGGLQRQGQGALLRAIAGGAKSRSGRLTIGDSKASFNSPAAAMGRGIFYVGGDRKELAFGSRPIAENLLASAWSRLGWFLGARRTTAKAADYADRLGVKRAGLDFPISSLSGGNAQKVLLARALVNQPDVLVLDDPTKGVDVMTKRQIYGTLRDLQRRGTAILLYSSEDEELLELAERVLVFHDGQVVAELSGPSLNKQALVAASMGIRQTGEVASNES